MKKLIKVLALIMILLMIMPSVVMASTPYSTYTYSIDGTQLNSPDAYVPDRLITFKEMGLDGTAAKLTDVESDKAGNIYIVDSANNRVIALDDNYVLKYVITDFVNSNGVNDTFSTPTSSFVVDEGPMKGLYICDTYNERIVVFDQEYGEFKRVIDKPDTTLFGKSSKYTPTYCAVDKHGRIYVVSQDTTEGLIVLTSSGDFINFIGAPRVTVPVIQALIELLVPAATKNQVNVPTTFKSIDLDSTSEEFVFGTIIFTDDGDKQEQYNQITSKDSDYSPVKMLNASGVDIMHRNGFFAPAGEVNASLNTAVTVSNKGVTTGLSSIIDVTSGPNGVWSIIDEGRSKVYTYDSDGNLLYIFGDKGNQLGNISTARSITYQGTNILVLDTTKSTVTVFRRTEYATILDEAIHYQNMRDYDKAVEKWQDVLSRNNNFDTAYVAIGQSLYRSGKYEEAITYYKSAYDVENYAIAFRDIRKARMETLFVPMIILIVVLFILLGKVFAHAAKINKDAQLVIGRKSFKQELTYGFHLMFHPFDGYWDLKHEKRGSVRASFVFIAATIIAFYYQSIGTGYYYNPRGTYLTIFTQAISVIIPITLFVIANWCFTTLFEGEGSLKDIFIATSYALFPVPVLIVVSTLLSNVLVGDEGQIITLITSIAYIWMGFLIIIGTSVTHDYSMMKNIITLISTIVGMVFIMFIVLLFSTLISKMVSFVSTIVSEVSYR